MKIRFSTSPLCAGALAAIATLAPIVLLSQGCSSTSDGGSVSSTADLGAADMAFRSLCSETTQPHHMRCRSYVRVEKATGKIHAQAAAAGPVTGTYGPADLQSAYGIPTSGGEGVTVAIVDAQDDPNAEADLAVYRSHYGLPPCTTANGCFKKIDQNGGKNYPTEDDGWAGEISLDLDMVSAACPQCKILLVEATSADNADLEAAIAEAAKLGAKAISNSWSGPEDSSVIADEANYHYPGVSVLAASGDNGFAEGTQFPASSQYVIAVGGTELDRSSGGRGWSEIVWGTNDPTNDGATGSGCSGFIPKPSFQKDASCKFRMTNDVAAVGDVVPGLAVYDTENAGGSGEGTGWIQVGGTSASTPLVAAILAATGNAGVDPSFFYSGESLYDVTSGNNGTCSTGYFCKGETGYDGPTGMGTPNAAAWGGAPVNAGPPPVDAGPGNAIVNGGFETGTFNGWTASGASETVASTGCHSGTYCALVGAKNGKKGSSNVAQTFTAPAGSSSISLWYSETCSGTIAAEWATASIADNTTGTSHKILVKTCATTGWKQVSHAITAGHSYTVTLSAYDGSAASPEYVYYDDVSVQ